MCTFARYGLVGAERILDGRLDVNNRDEYRHPDVTHDMRKAYRDAFRRGYEQAMSHLMQGGERRR
jgi:hypothetical protein